MREVRDHSASMVLTAAFALCGAGQMMNGQGQKGAVLILLSVVLVILLAVRHDARIFLISALLWGVALIDAVVIGRRIARGEEPGPWSWFFHRSR